MRSLPLLGDRYRLGPIIGTGGMGAVHRAYDERFGREVAVKVVRAGADAVEQERLRREAQYLAGLDHPNLVAVYDAGADRTRTGETVWFAMELMHGPDLRALIRERGRLAPTDVARVLDGCAGALQVLQTAGVIHRDLKPANVILTAPADSGPWEVKIADLGIAQLMKADHLTATGQVVGTAAYLSPEQVSGGRIGPASDVYALGLLAIEALTGRVPFPGGPAESATARLVRSPDVPAGAGPEWAALLREMTARDPRDRPSASEVAHRLALVRRSAEPIDDPDATTVLPGPLVPAARETAVLPVRGARPPVPEAAVALEDVATEAMPVVRETPHLPDHGEWSPSLRTRRTPRRRRHLLAAGAFAVVVALAGGGAAVLGGSTSDPVAAVTRPSHSSTPTPSATRAAASPTPSRTAAASATTAARVLASGTPTTQQKVAEAQQRVAAAIGRAAEHRAQKELRRLRQRLEHELGGPGR